MILKKLALFLVVFSFFVLPVKAAKNFFNSGEKLYVTSDEWIYLIIGDGNRLLKLDNETLVINSQTDLELKAIAVDLSGDVPITLSRVGNNMVITSFNPDTLEKTGDMSFKALNAPKDSGGPGALAPQFVRAIGSSRTQAERIARSRAASKCSSGSYRTISLDIVPIQNKFDAKLTFECL